MEEQFKAYVVTKGDYDDYRIVAVFNDRALAEDYVAPFAGYQIEEWPLNPPHALYVSAGMKFYNVTMFSDGVVPLDNHIPSFYVRELSSGLDDYDRKFGLDFLLFVYPSFDWPTIRLNLGRHGQWAVRGVVRAHSSDMAVATMQARAKEIVDAGDWPPAVTEWCNEITLRETILGFNGKWPDDFVRHNDYPHIHGSGPNGGMDHPKVPAKYHFARDYLVGSLSDVDKETI